MNDIMNIVNLEDKNYMPIIANVQEYLPVIEKDIKNFNKTQSRFMDNILTVSHPTPLRNIRQCLAEISKSKLALQESYYGLEKIKVKIKKLKRKLESETDDLEAQLLTIQIEKKGSQIFNIEENQKAALRKISNYMEQIKSIKEKYNLEDFTEFDFEAEEEKYHIMKAFEQAICAARAHGGIIDEGNHIYLHQLGINGAVAQKFVTELFLQEQGVIQGGNVPNMTFVYAFLDDMYTFFKGTVNATLDKKGMTAETISVTGMGDLSKIEY